MQTRYPELPYFVLGHSMGSLITRIYLTSCGDRLSGCILSGTAGPNPLARTGVRVADGLIHSKGMTYRSSFLSNLAFKNYNRKISEPQSTFDWLSRDPNVVQMFQSDAKCNFIFTAASSETCSRWSSAPITADASATHRTPCRFCSSPVTATLWADMDGVRRVAKLYRAAGREGSRYDFL